MVTDGVQDHSKNVSRTCDFNLEFDEKTSCIKFSFESGRMEQTLSCIGGCISILTGFCLWTQRYGEKLKCPSIFWKHLHP